MKVDWTRETTTRVVSNIMVLGAAIVLFFLISNLGRIWGTIGWFIRILTPFIFGIVIAFLLSGPTRFFESVFKRYLFKKKARHGAARALAVVASTLSSILVLGLIFYLVIPQLASSVMTLVSNLPGYASSFNGVIEDIANRFGVDSKIFEELFVSWKEIVAQVSNFLGAILPRIFDFSKQVTSGVANFFFGFVISIYLLLGKERFIAQIKKAMFAIFPSKFVTATVRIGKFTNKTFSRYLSGQILDSLILGIICFICMVIFRMEYALLISFIITITNLIPFFGPIIGAVPSAFILLMVNPIKALWFIVLIIVLQQLDGNFLAPRIVGNSTGLPAFWVMFAIFAGGGLFGFVGIILGVPAFSVLYVLAKNVFEKLLEKKGLPVPTGCYNDTEYPL